MSAIIPFPGRSTAPVDRRDLHTCVAATEKAARGMSGQRRLDEAARAKLEELVARLIDIMDQLDGDLDLEDGDDAEWQTDDNGIGDEDGLWEQRRG